MSLNEISLEKKLSAVTNSQDSIQSLSLWILHHKSHYKRIIQIWINCFEKAKPSHRLTLFYLANDVIQHAKRKGFPPFVDQFADSLKRATTLIKEDKISTSVDRVFNIWLERSIYSEEFIEELRALLSGTSIHLAAVSKIVAEFKLSELIEKIKKTKKAEQLSASKLDSLVNCKVDPTSGEVLNKLKDKTHGEQLSRDFDDSIRCLEMVINALEKEISLRSDLVESLEKSEVFYETQKEEANTVVDAYKNFGLRVKNVWKKLEESKSSLPSPLPSPPRDAPSPTNSDDGPNLPQMDVLGPEVNALLRQVVNEESKGLNHTNALSSLDQRLSNLMHSMPQMNENQKNSSNNFISHNNNQLIPSPQMQTMANSSIINDKNSNSFTNNNHWNTTTIQQNSINDPNISANYANDSIYPSHQTNQSYNQSIYDYNYCQPMQDINHQKSAEVQHIQALVSSRGDESKPPIIGLPPPPMIPNLLPPFHDYSPIVQPSENFELADMDLGNSDDEDIGANRLQTQRTIKVIETRREANENQLNSLTHNNSSNNDRMFNNNNINNMNNNITNSSPNRLHYMPAFLQNSPQLKSVARMPVRSSLNSVQQSHPYSHPSHPPLQQNQWRPTPRSAVMSAQHFSPQSSQMISPPMPPYNRNQHNWRSNNNNRNNRKTRY